jgi:puromycin-sensitive aminopeptidase
MSSAVQQEKFATIKAKLATASPSLMDAAIVYSCGGFCSADKAADIEGFFEANKLPSSARKIGQTLERIRVHAKFLDRLKQQIGDAALWKELGEGL